MARKLDSWTWLGVNSSDAFSKQVELKFQSIAPEVKLVAEPVKLFEKDEEKFKVPYNLKGLLVFHAFWSYESKRNIKNLIIDLNASKLPTSLLYILDGEAMDKQLFEQITGRAYRSKGESVWVESGVIDHFFEDLSDTSAVIGFFKKTLIL